MTTEPSPLDLWRQANGDGDRYRELLREHGMLLSAGDEGYEEARRNLACGWPGKSALDIDGPFCPDCGAPVTSADDARFWCVFCLEYIPAADVIQGKP